MLADLTAAGAAQRLDGPLLHLRRTVQVGLNEAVEVMGGDGRTRRGRVAALDEERMVVEVLEPTAGLDLAAIRVRFIGEPLRFGVGPGLLGRIFDGVGRPIDGGPPVPVIAARRIDGLPINPRARELPQDFIETGISSIDLLNSLVRGQKLPVFSGNGLPHGRMAVDIVRHARLLRDGAGGFATVFAGIGVAQSAAEQFRRAMEASGQLSRTVMFLNLASDSSAQRLLTPRYALTAAEHLAFTEGRHVLVVMTDMTNYCEALREVAASHGEVPGRKGYPGYMYSDLATLYERAGRIKGLPGTLTQLPVLTMPGDDITHPIPDLTGYITEGQIVLDRELDRRGLWPPIAVLPSLSRLIDQGVGEGFTDPDHPALAAQIYAAYARSHQVRLLASVVGEEGLDATDRLYLAFGEIFERHFLHQQGPRRFEETIALAWELLRNLPATELSRLSDAQIEQHLGPKSVAHA
ncbi:MAG: V-type ATP synthase subunit B [Gammaproteobacteria bacterium]|nr:V-type ATP synthase subunit B [Gammaproteobacteria bacterium]